MLQAILNKSWRQHLTRHQLYGHLPPITKTIQVRRTRHAGHSWRSRDEIIGDVLLWTPPPGQKQDDQLGHTFSSYVRIRDVALKTCQRRWTIGRSSERGSGISVLAAGHHDDDNIEIIFSPSRHSLSLQRDGLPDKIWIISNTFKRNEECDFLNIKNKSTLNFSVHIYNFVNSYKNEFIIINDQMWYWTVCTFLCFSVSYFCNTEGNIKN